ncbi:hypothetical protein CAC42_7334 [Sphaceloma murrayae]|uniref:Uncharacterized protein n=1 Tax=Sphaceloma murrayae TaxID=2082308 RepID=A0A2K1QX03_9PEZI|nr:hypothetical protein CAC42_7334 [Sphaceloma murrayae]
MPKPTVRDEEPVDARSRLMPLCSPTTSSGQSRSTNFSHFEDEERLNTHEPSVTPTETIGSCEKGSHDGHALSPLSPNVEIYRGPARHRHRAPLAPPACEDDNPFRGLMPSSELSSAGEDYDDSDNSDDGGTARMIPPTPTRVSTYF